MGTILIKQAHQIDRALVNLFNMSSVSPYAVLSFAKIDIIKCPLG